ncbi:MAG: tetratricopeptide repeat protein [Burkholderiales bacterium]|nr:tetratricopeptide repeat protein [Burkholderiales bacterium]
MATTNFAEQLDLAMSLHRSGQFASAEVAYHNCLAIEPQNSDAIYHLGILLSEGGRQIEARDFLFASLRLNPAVASRWVDLGVVLSGLSDQTGAKYAFSNALRLNPGLHDVRAALGDTLSALGEFEPARRCYEMLLPIWPAHAVLRSNLANALWHLGQYGPAEAHARQAVKLDPKLASAHNNLGNILKSAGDLGGAIQAYLAALAVDPRQTDAWKNLALAHSDEGSPASMTRAEDAFRRAMDLSPEDGAAIAGLADCLHMRGASGEAEALYRRALELDAADPVAASNLATLLLAQDLADDAEALLQGALRRRPDQPDVLTVLADCRRARQQVDDAEDLYLRSLAIRPSVRAWNNLGLLRLATCRAPQAVDAFRKALMLEPRGHNVHSNLLFALQHMPDSTPASLSVAHSEYGNAVIATRRAELARIAVDRDPDRRLTVGFLSPDFRDHSAARFLLPLLRGVDRSDFRIVLFSNSERTDQVSHELRCLSDGWVDCFRLGDQQLAAAVREAKVDVLVDLAGHTSGNRLPVLAHKPAPLQMTYLGYPGSTGLTQVDYRITDSLIDPDGEDRFFVERLLRLDCLMLAYEPAADILAVNLAAPPALRRKGHVTFGSFNSASKINDSLLDAWAEILLRVPGSRLYLAAIPRGRCARYIRDRLEGSGVAPSRIHVDGPLPSRQFRAAMLDVDIALDSFPVNGGTTTFECLWMGLPVIALAGSRTVSRFGMSILTRLGYSELVGQSVASYIEAAAVLAMQVDRIIEFRAGIRERLASRSGADTGSLNREFYGAIRSVWREYCAAAI